MIYRDWEKVVGVGFLPNAAEGKNHREQEKASKGSGRIEFLLFPREDGADEGDFRSQAN